MSRIIPIRILTARAAANNAMRKAQDLAAVVAENMAYQVDPYVVPRLRETLADLRTAIDDIEVVHNGSL